MTTPEDRQRSDATLLQTIADGDRSALALLYDRHAAWLVLRLRQRCDDPGLVDETVQDTFVRVWRKTGTWRGEGEVGAWLWGIAIRRLIDGLRKRHPMPQADVGHRRDATTVAAEDAGVPSNRQRPDIDARLEAAQSEPEVTADRIEVTTMLQRGAPNIDADRLDLGLQAATRAERALRRAAADAPYPGTPADPLDDGQIEDESLTVELRGSGFGVRAQWSKPAVAVALRLLESPSSDVLRRPAGRAR